MVDIITAKEATALLAFREKISDLTLDDEKNSDSYLLRWLRARDLSIKKSEDLLRAHLKWREEENIDAILEWQPPIKYKSMYPMELCGYDKNGYPILVAPARFNDPEDFWSCDQKEYMKYCVRNMEEAIMHMKKYSTSENQISQCVILYDLDQINLRPFMNRKYMEIMQEQSKFFNENYPEMIHRGYFLYSPKLFTVLFSMIKHVIPKKTVEKFRIFGCDKESWLPELRQHIDDDVLPGRFGGNNTVFDETAFKDCKLPGANRRFSSICGEKYTSAVVGAGKKLELNYKVEQNAAIKYVFRTDHHDIGFCVHLDGEQIVESGRVNSHKIIQEGIVACSREGEYTIELDNTYSKMRSKTVFYMIEIVDPPKPFEAEEE